MSSLKIYGMEAWLLLFAFSSNFSYCLTLYLNTQTFFGINEQCALWTSCSVVYMPSFFLLSFFLVVLLEHFIPQSCGYIRSTMMMLMMLSGLFGISEEIRSLHRSVMPTSLKQGVIVSFLSAHHGCCKQLMLTILYVFIYFLFWRSIQI